MVAAPRSMYTAKRPEPPAVPVPGSYETPEPGVSRQIISEGAKGSGWRRDRASYCGSEGGPVTLPVFKTGDWRLAVSMVRSTRTRFRQDFECVAGERNSRHSVVLGDTATGHICGMRAGLWARK